MKTKIVVSLLPNLRKYIPFLLPYSVHYKQVTALSTFKWGQFSSVQSLSRVRLIATP